jgi:thioredoxin-related protein
MTRLIATCLIILACGLAVSGAASAASGLVHAKNLQADAQLAAKRQVPILVVFTSPGCHYCERVKSEYLAAMNQDPAYRSKVIIREITMGDTKPLTDFNGTSTTEGEFAATHKVFMVPTVIVFDTNGAETSEAIVGLLSPDYYFGYLLSAIETGMDKVRGK